MSGLWEVLLFLALGYASVVVSQTGSLRTNWVPKMGLGRAWAPDEVVFSKAILAVVRKAVTLA